MERHCVYVQFKWLIAPEDDLQSKHAASGNIIIEIYFFQWNVSCVYIL
jgi:hypothetical protein